MQSIVYKKNRIPVFKGSREAAETYIKRYSRGNTRFTIVNDYSDIVSVLETSEGSEDEKKVKNIFFTQDDTSEEE